MLNWLCVRLSYQRYVWNTGSSLLISLFLHLSDTSTVNEECIIHTCDCTREGTHTFYAFLPSKSVKWSNSSPLCQYSSLPSNYFYWHLTLASVIAESSPLLARLAFYAKMSSFLLMTRLCRGLEQQWHGGNRLQTCTTLAACSGLWVTDESLQKRKSLNAHLYTEEYVYIRSYELRQAESFHSVTLFDMFKLCVLSQTWVVIMLRTIIIEQLLYCLKKWNQSQ